MIAPVEESIVNLPASFPDEIEYVIESLLGSVADIVETVEPLERSSASVVVLVVSKVGASFTSSSSSSTTGGT